jgi:UDP-N-acetylglucosamine--N-acetylmuramyl-(pentapeptide) pyrophosphoryl-undecaprenol N-acetylglucosamine transferase
MAAHEGGIHQPQSELTAEGLARLLQGLTREDLLKMAINARKLGRPNATTAIANEIEEVALP